MNSEWSIKSQFFSFHKTKSPYIPIYCYYWHPDDSDFLFLLRTCRITCLVFYLHDFLAPRSTGACWVSSPLINLFFRLRLVHDIHHKKWCSFLNAWNSHSEIKFDGCIKPLFLLIHITDKKHLAVCVFNEINSGKSSFEKCEIMPDSYYKMKLHTTSFWSSNIYICILKYLFLLRMSLVCLLTKCKF